jgi:hypothetical protein
MAALGICLAAGAFHAHLAGATFTLAWQHSIEKVRWEEDYRVEGAALVLSEARIRGTGAGMEPPEGALLEHGVWRYRPRLPPLPRLTLARSGYVRDYELCLEGRCRPLSAWIPVTAGTTTLAPCSS